MGREQEMEREKKTQRRAKHCYVTTVEKKRQALAGSAISRNPFPVNYEPSRKKQRFLSPPLKPLYEKKHKAMVILVS